MGGSAFQSLNLSVPRMPPKVYYKVLTQVQTKLRQVYSRVETPIEGPAKKNHGDIDVLVLAKPDSQPPHAEKIKELLGSTHWNRIPNSTTTHYALPWPEEDELPSTDFDSTTNPKPHYIQLDINLCSTAEHHNYLLFAHAHGDMWTILGTTIRRFGLTSSDSGLYIRIAELEPWNKSLARVKLTTDPVRVLEYLGLDPKVYTSRFASWDDAMDYAAKCRFHDPSRGKEHDAKETEVKDELTAHDRSKYKKRPMFRCWLEEYMPTHRDGVAGSASQMSREEVILDMKAFFGEEITREFDTLRAEGNKLMGMEQLWSDIRKEIGVTGSDLTFAMKGLKFEIMDDEYAAVAAGQDDGIENTRAAYKRGEFAVVKEWALGNWRMVKERQETRGREKSDAKLREHFEKLELKKQEKEEERGEGDGQNGDGKREH